MSSPPCLPRLLPAGAIAGGALHPLEKRRVVTAHAESGRSRVLRSSNKESFLKETQRFKCGIQAAPERIRPIFRNAGDLNLEIESLENHNRVAFGSAFRLCASRILRRSISWWWTARSKP
jgi:hypothetical protein